MPNVTFCAACASVTHYFVQEKHQSMADSVVIEGVTLRRVLHFEDLNQLEARDVMVESFVTEYSHPKNELVPQDIAPYLTQWRGDDDSSTAKYYEKYYWGEVEDFRNGKVDYWIEASIDGKLAGWATFLKESEPNAVYMNLLVVHPGFQRRNIGNVLVYSLVQLGIIPDLNRLHLFLRKTNKGGALFYRKLGFFEDASYKRPINFVNPDSLVGWTWRKAA